jgi:hypothetical protein
MERTKTNSETDAYIFNSLPECLMSLIDVFDESNKVNALIDKLVILLSRIKDSLIKKETGQKLIRLKNIIQGVN